MHMSFNSTCILLICGVALCGCETSDVTMVTARDFGYSSPRVGSVGTAKLASGDAVEVSVEVDGRLEVPLTQASVNHLGFVTLPLVGDVQIAGVGLDVARETVSRRYETYYVTKPVITLSLVGEDGSAEWGQVLVTGRGVGDPGPVPLTSGSGMRLSAVIQTAGGFAPAANTSKIQITRVDGRGRKLRVVVDFDDIGSGGDKEADILLRDGDIVNVPERIW